MQNKIKKIQKHIVLQRNMEENIIKSVGVVVKEPMNKNKIEYEIKRCIIHKQDETHINNFYDIMKADLNNLSELLEEGMKIQMPDIS